MGRQAGERAAGCCVQLSMCDVPAFKRSGRSGPDVYLYGHVLCYTMVDVSCCLTSAVWRGHKGGLNLDVSLCLQSTHRTGLGCSVHRGAVLSAGACIPPHSMSMLPCCTHAGPVTACVLERVPQVRESAQVTPSTRGSISAIAHILMPANLSSVAYAAICVTLLGGWWGTLPGPGAWLFVTFGAADVDARSHPPLRATRRVWGTQQHVHYVRHVEGPRHQVFGDVTVAVQCVCCVCALNKGQYGTWVTHHAAAHAALTVRRPIHGRMFS